MDENNKIILKAVGAKLRKARIAKGMTQVDLSKALGYKDSTTIHKIEKGILDIPVHRLRDIARVLDVDIDYFTSDVDYVYHEQGIDVVIEKKKGTRQELLDDINRMLMYSSDEDLAKISGVMKVMLGGSDYGNSNME